MWIGRQAGRQAGRQCAKHAKFLTSHMPTFEYHSPMYCKARSNFVVRAIIIDTHSQNFLGGGGSFPLVFPQ